MKIRYANINDAKDIAKNAVLLAKESENVTIKYDTVFEGVKSIISDKTKGLYIVATENNIIIGQLMITYEWSDWHNNNVWWLQSVYVIKSYRRKGVFSQLFEYIKKNAREHGVDVIRLYVYDENIRAKETYNALEMDEKPYRIYQLSLK